jgi:hypothetical protein
MGFLNWLFGNKRQPPPARQVAARAMVLSTIVCRAYLEVEHYRGIHEHAEGGRGLLSWLAKRGLQSELVVGAGLLINDAVALFYSPDEYVFVSREGHDFEVWSNVSAFESATGQDWIKQTPGTTGLSATYHNARRDQAVSRVPGQLLFVVLSVVALRKARQVG